LATILSSRQEQDMLLNNSSSTRQQKQSSQLLRTESLLIFNHQVVPTTCNFTIPITIGGKFSNIKVRDLSIASLVKQSKLKLMAKDKM